ncbi:MAG TPA: hypothetical protein ENK89_05160 [Desulfobulbaceae bacterium]|nr:hypothetical protein [Desulfobulbaceae bacterium]
MTHATLTLNILFSVLCTVAGVTGFIFIRRRQRREREKIKTLCRKVKSALNDNEDIRKTPVFADSLKNASIVTGFQQPRLELQAGKAGRVPEKYKFFAGLIARGMSTNEISEILGISPAEAGQLATLSVISRGEGW